jgi:nitric oxide reductase subunit B
VAAAPSPTASRPDRRTLMVGKGWVQAVALVVVFGFLVMGILAYRTYTASMPQPEKVVTGNGDVLFTGADITAGQELFLARGLMEYGSIVGPMPGR